MKQMCKHFSTTEKLNKIYDSKQLWLTRLCGCKNQEDFSLTKSQFLNIIKSINFDSIEYDAKFFSKEQFELMCKITEFNDDFDKGKFYGACVTKDGSCKKFKKKYGGSCISFDLGAIKKRTFNSLIIWDVFYSLKGNGQFIYDLAKEIYIKYEYCFDRINLIDYKNMITRLFYYCKILYKPKKFRFEAEVRIVVDAAKMETGIDCDDSSSRTIRSLDVTWKKHIINDNDKYILLLDSYDGINLELKIANKC